MRSIQSHGPTMWKKKSERQKAMSKLFLRNTRWLQMNSRTINQQLMLFMIKPLLWVKKTENQVLVLKDFLQLTEVATGCVELPRSGSRDCWMPCHSTSCSQKQMMWSNGAQTRRKCWALWCQAWKSKDWESHEADFYNPQQEPDSPTMWEVLMRCRIQGTPCVSSLSGRLL